MCLDIGSKNLPKKCQIWKLLHKPVDYSLDTLIDERFGKGASTLAHLAVGEDKYAVCNVCVTSTLPQGSEKWSTCIRRAREKVQHFPPEKHNNGRNGSFYVAGYLIEERRRWPVITAPPRGQCSK